jgi:hypothetical protein
MTRKATRLYLYSRLSSTAAQQRQHRFSSLISRFRQKSTANVNQNDQQSPCKLCTEHRWLQGPPYFREGARVSYDVLAASAEHGCDACTLLCTVFGPFTSNPAKPIDIQFDPTRRHPSKFVIWRWESEYDGWEDKERIFGKQTHVRLSECLGGGTFDCQLPSPEGSEYEGSAINCVRCFSSNKDNYKLY